MRQLLSLLLRLILDFIRQHIWFKTRGNGHKVKHRGFSLNIRKHIFTVRVTQHWHRLPREILEYPSLEILKIHLDTALSNWLRMALLEHGELNKMTFGSHFQPQHFCVSLILWTLFQFTPLIFLMFSLQIQELGRVFWGDKKESWD